MQVIQQRQGIASPSQAARRPSRPVAVRCENAGSSTRPSSSGPQPNRRQLLSAVMAAPLLQCLPWAAGQPAAAAEIGGAGPRYLTPEQQAAVDGVFAAVMPKSKAPVMVRLVFHDAGTFSAATGDGGVNASIRFELDRPDNFGLKRGWNVIEAAALRLKGTAADGLVSKADLVVLAAAYGVRITGGPAMRVAVGRLDAAAADPDGRMPELDFSAQQQLANFADKGLDAQEFVALCGSHTLGSKGYGDPVTFDNTYYKTLLAAPWTDKKNEMAQHTGIATDHVLADDPTCRPLIQRYAADQPAFFRDFASAFEKMSCVGVQWA
ncbi:putative L-ascorbate peroxidase 6 [Chlorella vulgaris]